MKETEKRNLVYDLMNIPEEYRRKAEGFASSGKTKTERNIRAGWFLGKHFEDLQKAKGNADETERA